MYCSSCGIAVAQGLGYCNHCGAKLNTAKNESLIKSQDGKPERLVSAMVTVFVLGLLAITLLLGVMKSVLGLNAGQIMAFAILSFLVMLLIEGVCIWLLFSRHRSAKEVSDAASSKNPVTKELEAEQMRVLPEPLVSVTDHTTRTFDPIYSERKSK